MRTVYFDLTDTSDERYDRPIEAMLLGLLAFAPLALGAVQAWSELVVIALAAAMSLMLAVKLFRRRDVPFIWSWTYLPIAGLLLLGIMQLIPLPVSMLKWMSPYTVSLKTSLLSAWPGNAGDIHVTTLSFYPEATAWNLRLLAAISAVYVVSLNTIRQISQVRRMLRAIAILGAGIAVIALIHLLAGAPRVYWRFGEQISRWTTAPFISRNHFGQFMNLCLGASTGLMLWRMGEITASQRHHEPLLVPRGVWILGACLMLMLVSLFFSLSRGAMMSLTISVGLASILAMRRGMRARLWLFAPLIWVAALFIIYFGFDLMVGRFAQVVDGRTGVVAGRMTILKDTLQAWRHVPIAGFGLGTFETAHPMFDSSNAPSLATHAENEFAQALFEGGAIELALILIFLLIVARQYWRAVRSSISLSPAIGLGIGLAAIILQSFVDFGQHLPANALLSAVFCAMLGNLADLARRTKGTGANPSAGNRSIRGAMIVAIAAISLFGIGDAFGAARAEWNWFKVTPIEATLREHDWRTDQEMWQRILVAATDAADARPGDIHYRYWLNVYRWQYVASDRDPQTGEILMDPQRLQLAANIVTDLRRSIDACPTYGPAYALAGELNTLILRRTDGEQLVRLGYELAQNDPSAAFDAAYLAAKHGDWEQAVKTFQHSAALDASYRSSAGVSLAREFHRTDLAIQIAGDDVPTLRAINESIEKTGDTSAFDEIHKRLSDAIRAHAADPEATPEMLIDAARLSILEKDANGAIAYLQRALMINPTRADCRLELARALAANGEIKRALSEASVAERMGASGAAALVVELRLRPSTQPTSNP